MSAFDHLFLHVLDEQGECKHCKLWMDTEPYPMDECPVLLRLALNHMVDFVTTLQLLKGAAVKSPLEDLINKMGPEPEGPLAVPSQKEAWWKENSFGDMSLNSEENCLVTIGDDCDRSGDIWEVSSDNDIFDIGCESKTFKSRAGAVKFVEKIAKKLGWTIID